MTSSKLDTIGNFMKRWSKSVVFFGYNKNLVLCFYIKQGSTCREVPYSWELIQDNGLTRAWKEIKAYLARTHSFAYDLRSEMIIEKGGLE